MSKIKEILEKFNIPLCREPYERKEISTIHGEEYKIGTLNLTWGSLSDAFHDKHIEIWDRQRPDIGAGNLKNISSQLSTVFFGEQPNDVFLCIVKEENQWKIYVLNGHQRLSGLDKFRQENKKLPDDKFYNERFDIDGVLTCIGGYNLHELEETLTDWFFNNVLSRQVDIKYIILGDDWDKDDKISTMVHYFVYSNEAISYNHRLPALNTEFTNQLFDRDRIIYPKHKYTQIVKEIRKLDEYTQFKTSINNTVKGVTDNDITSMVERKNIDLILYRYGLYYICQSIENKNTSLFDLIKFLKSLTVETVYRSLEKDKENSKYNKFFNDVEIVDDFFDFGDNDQNVVFNSIRYEFKNKGVKYNSKAHMKKLCTSVNINYHVAMVCILSALSGKEFNEIIEKYVELFESAYLNFTLKTFKKWSASEQKEFKAKVKRFNHLTNKDIEVEYYDNFESELAINMRGGKIINMLLELVGYGMFDRDEINDRVLNLLEEKHKVK